MVTEDGIVSELGTLARPPGFAPGQAVDIMIRPDDIDFIPHPEGDVVVIGRQFLGAEHLYRLRLTSGARVHSVQPATTLYPVGRGCASWRTCSTSSRFRWSRGCLAGRDRARGPPDQAAGPRWRGAGAPPGQPPREPVRPTLERLDQVAPALDGPGLGRASAARVASRAAP